MQTTHNAHTDPQHRITSNGGGDSNGSSPRIHALQAELALLQQKYAFEAAQAHMLSSPDFAVKQEQMMQQEQHIKQQIDQQIAYHSAGSASEPDEAEGQQPSTSTALSEQHSGSLKTNVVRCG